MPDSPYVARKIPAPLSFRNGGSLALGHLDLELTERCNNRCVHCCINLPTADQKARKRELTVTEVKGILSQAVSLGCLSVRFTGGEPLLRDDFEDIYVFARSLGLFVRLFTNATLITPHLARLFSRVPPLRPIEVSVYGMKKSSYEAVTRSKGSFKAFRRGVELLQENGVAFTIKFALLPANRDELDELERWALSIPGMGGLLPVAMFFDLRGRREQDRNRLIRKLRVTPEEGVKVLSRNEEEFIDCMKRFCSRCMRPPGKSLFPCGAGCGGCVDAYGKFQPCLLLRAPALAYDLRKGSLKDAVERHFPRVRRLKAEHAGYLKRCARCFLHGLCEQCPGKSWSEHGDLDTPVEYLCDVAHAQARFLGLITAGEHGWDIRDWRKRIRSFTHS
ncbi:MAG: radical SAM/SPASM domain-containing protein [Deltaproteobacteria bacterium]